MKGASRMDMEHLQGVWELKNFARLSHKCVIYVQSSWICEMRSDVAEELAKGLVKLSRVVPSLQMEHSPVDFCNMQTIRWAQSEIICMEHV